MCLMNSSDGSTTCFRFPASPVSPESAVLVTLLFMSRPFGLSGLPVTRPVNSIGQSKCEVRTKKIASFAALHMLRGDCRCAACYS